MVAIVEKRDKSAIEGKFLIFILGSEAYGIEIHRAREIIGLLDITEVPQSPEYVKGVINLRGKVMPVVDLRLKFLMDEESHSQKKCIIVVDVNNTSIGLIVDSVSDVTDISSGEIEVAPDFSVGIDPSFIMGLGRESDRVIIMLDMEIVLSADKLEAFIKE